MAGQSVSMHLVKLTGAATLLLLPQAPSIAEQSNSAIQVGDTYQITKLRESSSQGSDGSSGSTHDKDTLVERVDAVHPDGLELVYDLPVEASEAERADSWQFPARVFEPFQGPPQLLNRSELETRLDAWLTKTKLPRDSCGKWIFTWNAFRIECDPEFVIETVKAFDLRVPGIHDGALYRDADALEPAPLVTIATGKDGSSFSAELMVDPDVVRREGAKSDVVVSELMGKPVTLDQALHRHANEEVSGTISVTFDTDASGKVRRRLKVTKIETKEPNGVVQKTTTTETLERKLISSSAS